MSNHTYGPLSFQAPSEWRERTVLTFVAPESAGPSRSNIVVSGDTKLPGENLHALVHRRSTELTKLPGFKMHELWELTVGGRPAVRTRFESLRGTTTVDCIVVYVDPPSGDDVLTITTSCNASSPPSRAWLDALDALLASADFGGPEARRQSAPPPPPSSNQLLPLVPTPAAAWQRDSAVPLPPPMIPMPGMRQRR
jgi:hypothetical protein